MQWHQPANSPCKAVCKYKHHAASNTACNLCKFMYSEKSTCSLQTPLAKFKKRRHPAPCSRLPMRAGSAIGLLLSSRDPLGSMLSLKTSRGPGRRTRVVSHNPLVGQDSCPPVASDVPHVFSIAPHKGFSMSPSALHSVTPVTWCVVGCPGLSSVGFCGIPDSLRFRVVG